ncbi:NAD(P)H-hydrate epimerase [Caldanaerobacter subterraneus subsp. tengcongensis MB4]|uniref:Bifunctional NAD(P)H-hydrate repair enzyme n=1 Tax=Caldanaerobacter subterraneus subsp. tengcongensis (strain DSM 15242 / JCM 11007 / NBRC 100824 / MB4) TaxID=273068 RepID=Q8R858_CALS4|nr:bifunctional ADP-dependent NAD(P)H-hydrate dehydratase/NAD(P)H-hydrate epimerase [Caldanaerobacter subterraneus]AAM25329.1 predicted sugar kinase [Caldanaerobacter subterraneus subsp. tengcongensis MB4]MCS3915067.1 NAD(P)H-hydrate epimerase [Caldanaerobacter subterraneus subsp. tengcongensis MB4]
MIVLTSQQMREVERIAIEKMGIPSICLMENAGKEVAWEVKRVMEENGLSSAVVIAGRGNNGGDGYVVARNLYNWGIDVKVFVIGSIGSISGDARVNLEAIRNLGIYVAEVTQKEHLKFLEKTLKDSDLVVDAIYGTGLRGEVTGLAKEVIELINQSEKFVVAVDIPSGLNADTGRVEGAAVKARITITMHFLKPGLLIYPGIEYAGEVKIADIGIPSRLAAEVRPSYHYVVSQDVALKSRNPDTHKGDYGKVLIVAGSRSMTGAAFMAAKSAVKTGSGLVRLAVPLSIQPVIQSALYEAIIYGLNEEGGVISYKSLSQIFELIEQSDAVAIGPGLTHEGEVSKLIEDVIRNTEKPLVLDADALNALVGRLEVVKGKRVILTPHYGEMARLTGLKVEDIKNNIFEVARSFVRRYEVTLVLKGARTVIATRDGSIYINSTGNAGMATGGSGDVLTGMIVSLLGQGFEEEKAAVYGVFYHGKAGDVAKKSKGEYGMTAVDILESIPEALSEGLKG